MRDLFFKQAVELGITFKDTANVYQLGSSEEIVGRAIKKYSRREDIVLATKVHFAMHEDSPRCNTSPSCMAGPSSCPCRTCTT